MQALGLVMCPFTIGKSSYIFDFIIVSISKD